MIIDRKIKEIVNEATIGLQDCIIRQQGSLLDKASTKLDNNKRLLDVEKKIGSFAVAIDNLEKAADLLLLAEDLDLTMEKGKHYPNDPRYDRYPSLLSFFIEGNSDIGFIQNPEEGLFRNIKPVYSANDDYYLLKRKIREAASKKQAFMTRKSDSKKTLRALYLQTASEVQRVENGIKIAAKKVNKPNCSCNKKKTTDVYVEVYDHFIQVDGQIIPKRPNDCLREINVYV